MAPAVDDLVPRHIGFDRLEERPPNGAGPFASGVENLGRVTSPPQGIEQQGLTKGDCQLSGGLHRQADHQGQLASNSVQPIGAGQEPISR